MRNGQDKSFAEMLADDHGVTAGQAVVYTKDEGDYVVTKFYQTREDFIAGVVAEDLGWTTRTKAKQLAKRHNAVLVQF